MKSMRLTIIVFILAGFLMLLYVGCTAPIQESSVGAPPTATERDWYTDQESVAPGDWDATIIYDPALSTISRVATPQAGEYSYAYYEAAAALYAWAQTNIECTTPIYTGHLDAWAMFPDRAEPNTLPGNIEDARHDILSVFQFNSIDPVLHYPIYDDYWDVYFNFPEKRAFFRCSICDPEIEWTMGTMDTGRWYHFTVDWNLPEGVTGTAWVTVAQDETIWIDESGLDTVSGPPFATPNAVGVGAKAWHSFFSSGWTILVDEVTIYPCDEPWPTPTPTPGVYVCDQYGHASVLNVDDDCSAVLRFRAVPNDVPRGAAVERATLYLYGVSVEQDDSTVYVAPLTTVWGEMTCDWCRRTVGEAWALPGATSVPEDRFPGSVAEFTAALGWVEVDIPTYIVEEWAMTSAANPGFVLSNSGLTGKYGIASREWVDADYRPYMVVYYTE